MNTLQKIADLEQKIGTFESKMKVFEILATSMPALKQDIGRLNSGMADMTNMITRLVDNVNKKNNELSQMDNMVITRLMGLEQSLASVSKTLAAVVSELSDNKVIDQKSVMNRLQKNDEKMDQERVEQLISLKVIDVCPEVLPDSLIVVSQTFTPKAEGSEVDIVAEYRSMDLSDPQISEDSRKEYVGKKSGDVVELNLEDGTLKTTILQAYAFVQKFAEGQGESQQNETPDQETQDQTEASN